ncbi:hypothetical protein [Pseudomonas pharyngis]|uniref:hypothetical protein n=1 Tax=Pseudomonas pharyngis TaxID=2892333 RepID=UPI001F287096|nr:hypothetical protein [Pseudomonas pharyngis]
MIRVLLSLDLIDSEDQRDELYEILKKKNWQKTKDVDTVWTLGYTKLDPSKESDFVKIKNNITSTLITASKNLKLKKIYYVAQLGNNEVIARVIKKVDGEYKAFKRDLYEK